VPDDVVVAIVSERIEQPDAARGFILDGFPRTVPQAQALEQMLSKKGLRLDAVVELKVDPDILVRRIENRVEQTRLRGEPLRPDDNPDVLKQRLSAYHAQTAPLVAHYAAKGALRTVDGMASVSEVSSAIGRALADAAFRPISAKPGSTKPRSAKKAAGTSRKSAAGAKKAAAKSAGARAKASAKAPSKRLGASATAKPPKSGARRAAAARTRPAAKRKSHPNARPRRLTK
jgi:adenylate kinase